MTKFCNACRAEPGWKVHNPNWPSGEGEHLIPCDHTEEDVIGDDYMTDRSEDPFAHRHPVGAKVIVQVDVKQHGDYQHNGKVGLITEQQMDEDLDDDNFRLENYVDFEDGTRGRILDYNLKPYDKERAAMRNDGHEGHVSLMPPRTSGKAVVGLIFSLLWLGGIGSAIGIVLGNSARKEMRRNRMVGGHGIAVAAITIGYFLLIPTVLFVLVGIWAINA